MSGKDIEPIVNTSSQILIRQKKEWLEILSDWETRNKYEILTPTGGVLGYIAEKPKGLARFFLRSFLGSHRPLDIEVLNESARPVLHLRRGFFLIFSTLEVYDNQDRLIGYVKRRFGLLRKKYDLLDAQENVFAQISAPLWRIWTFPVWNQRGDQVGCISKKWQGLLKEAFTDADQFLVDFGSGEWTLSQRSILLGAAISVDFDFFENNQD